MTTKAQATIEDLYRVPDSCKVEIVNGEVVRMSPTGDEPGYAGDEIFVSLRSYARRRKKGRAVPTTLPFIAEGKWLRPNRKPPDGKCRLMIRSNPEPAP